jgi:hypothetical protein
MMRESRSLEKCVAGQTKWPVLAIIKSYLKERGMDCGVLALKVKSMQSVAALVVAN